MKKNFIANLIGRFWSIFSNFLFIPLYIRFLGFESYSIISFTLIIAGLLAILDAGLTATLSREFARSDNEFSDKLRIYKTLESMYIIVVLVSIISVFISSDYIASNWLNIETSNKELVSLYLKIFSFDIAFQLLFRFYTGGLLGLEKQVKANLLIIAWSVIRNGLVVALIFFIPSLTLFFIWQSVSSIVFAILQKVLLEKQIYKKITLNFKFVIEIDVFKQIWRYAAGMMLISIVAALNTQLDKLTISRLLSLEVLGYYTLAISLSHGISAISSPFSSTLLPRFTSLYTNKNYDSAFNLFNKSGQILSVLIFSAYSILTFFGKEILYIWTGELNLANNAYLFLPILSLSVTMLSLAVIPFLIAMANGYTKLNNIIGLISLVITLPGYIYAVNNYGAIGAAIVYCTVQTITTLIYYYFINKKFLKKSIISIYYSHIIKPISTSFLIVFLLSLLPFNQHIDRFYQLFVILMYSTITVIICFLLNISIVDLKRYLSINHKFLKKKNND